MKKVQIYSRPLCDDCNKAKAFLKSKGVKFEDVTISRGGPAHDEMVERYGTDVCPLIIIDDQVMVGFNPPKINKILSNH